MVALWAGLDRIAGRLHRVDHRGGPELGVPRLVCCGMWGGGGVDAGALGVDFRPVLLNGGHYLGLPHVVYGLRHFGGRGWKFVAETLVEGFFGLQGGAIEVVGAAPVAE